MFDSPHLSRGEGATNDTTFPLLYSLQRRPCGKGFIDSKKLSGDLSYLIVHVFSWGLGITPVFDEPTFSTEQALVAERPAG